MATNNSTNTGNPQTVAQGGTGVATLTGIVIGSGTSAFTGNAVTQYNALIGGASNAISSVAPSATSGVPLISQGSSSNPAFGTAVVAGGGTGVATMTTAYAPVCAGTTATGNLQVASTGLSTSGFVLTSTGASSLPTFQAPAWVKLQSQTASASANISFSSTYITSTYTNYMVLFSGVNNATTTVSFSMTFSTNNGSSYLATGYLSGLYSQPYNSATVTNTNSTTSAILLPANAATSVQCSGQIFLSLQTSAIATYRGHIQNNITTTPTNVIVSGVNTGTTTINNIKFAYSSGNITSGTFTLYGLQQ